MIVSRGRGRVLTWPATVCPTGSPGGDPACGVFEKAQSLIEKSRARAETLADEVQPDSLRQLLYFLVDMVLAEESTEPAIAAGHTLVPLPVVTAG